jgi:fibro-slime domain-containing protein
MSFRHRLALFTFFSALLAAGLSCSANAPGDPSLTGGSNGTGNGGSSSGGTSASGGSGSGSTIGPPKPTPLTPGCGNGEQNEFEECDDSNLDGGDGCNGACRVEADWLCPQVGACVKDACGNGTLASFEICDDGNMMSGDGCSADCQTIEDGWQCRVPGKRCVPLCGDGKLTGTEGCDDGNAVNADGCASTCLVEAGATCDTTVQPSVCTVSVCGNAMVEAGETCDKGTAENGLFYGDETGCSKTCTKEPKCRDGAVTRACDTACGDGNIDEGEQCDDGNGRDNDGCSATCMEEPGFTCTPLEKPDTVDCPSAPGVECLVLPVTYRDFDPSTSKDFFYLGKNSVTCVPNASGTPVPYTAGDACPSSDASGPCAGIAAATLGADGKPTLANNMCRCIFTDWDQTGVISTAPTCWVENEGSMRNRIDTMVKVVDSPESFKTWYTGPGVKGTLELASTGTGYQFSSSIPGAAAGTPGRTVNEDIHANCTGPVTPLQSGFFPLDTMGTKICNIWPYWIYGAATTDAACRAGAGFPAISQWDPLAAWDACPTLGTGGHVPRSDGTGTPIQGVMHNFYFTTEARYLFRYSGTQSTLSFFGDDDVWVFVNGKLKLDLGAPHERVMGTATIGDAADGLVAGKIYEIAVFHADRHPRESNYQLTLSGFSTSLSNCAPTCGDGVATAAEECDLGTVGNTGAYGGCTADCHYGAWCGDGTAQTEINPDTGAPYEQCDNGYMNNGATYSKMGATGACTRGCTFAHFCGDGFIDSSDGEQCDDGSANGMMGSRCDAGCILRNSPK